MKRIACLLAGLAIAGTYGSARAQSAADARTPTTTETPTTITDQDGSQTEIRTAPEIRTSPVYIDPSNPDPNATTIPPPRGNDDVYVARHDYKKGIASGIGMGFLVGGGLSNFTASAVREATEMGAGWNATMIFGTRSIIGLEAAYNGTVNDINSLGLSGDTKLLATGVSGMARVNFTKTALQPYLLGGAGWKHYALSGAEFNTSSVRNDDNVVEVPMGAGLAYHSKGFMVDARGLYNYALNSNMFSTAASGEDLHNWGAKLNLGFEF